MNKLTAADVNVPSDVPKKFQAAYTQNYLDITKSTGRLMLFAGDQKIEHLNDDFYGENIPADDNDPEHLFKIADQGEIGVFATQYGLIAHYGSSYPNIPYLIKLNSKTNLVKVEQNDPFSPKLLDVKQALVLSRNGNLNVKGFGYTVYIGSEHEDKMLQEASKIIHDAHQNGLLTILWLYPRGKSVTDEFDPHLIAGAAGVAACLGADFTKVNVPKSAENPIEAFKEATVAAGRTGVITAGGSSKPPQEFLQQLHDLIHISGTVGNATGRNVHQKPLDEAVRFTRAISALTYEDKSADEAYKIFQG